MTVIFLKHQSWQTTLQSHPSSACSWELRYLPSLSQCLRNTEPCREPHLARRMVWRLNCLTLMNSLAASRRCHHLLAWQLMANVEDSTLLMPNVSHILKEYDRIRGAIAILMEIYHVCNCNHIRSFHIFFLTCIIYSHHQPVDTSNLKWKKIEANKKIGLTG